jgi:hypothetical protein
LGTVHELLASALNQSVRNQVIHYLHNGSFKNAFLVTTQTLLNLAIINYSTPIYHCFTYAILFTPSNISDRDHHLSFKAEEIEASYPAM